MTARGHREVVLSDFRARKMDEGAVDVKLDDGSTIVIPPPQIWPDDVLRLARAEDLEGAGVALLGKDEYRRFCEAGGSGAVLSAIVADTLGLSPPE